MRTKPIAFVLFATLLAAWPALGGLVTYSDRPAWEAASTGLTNISFSGVAVSFPWWVQYDPATGVTDSGVTFTAQPESTIYIIDPSAGVGYEIGYGAWLSTQYAPSYECFYVAMPAGVTSLGFYFLAPTGENFSFTSGVGSFDLTGLTEWTTHFLGVTSTAPISSFTFTLNNPGPGYQNLNLDEFAFGTAVFIPEPGTAALLAAGCLILAARRRTRRAPSAS